MTTRHQFYPARAPIDAYGNGGFRFADMSHRGSLLLLASGIQGWDIVDPAGLTLASLAPVLAAGAQHEFLLLGTGATQVFPSLVIRRAFDEAGIGLEVMSTGAAARTYNILLAEKRVAEVRERQLRETEALRAQADREAQSRAQAEKSAAEASARAKAEADWIRRIQSKVKGNVIVPAELAGNPEAIFDVVQLPTGEIIEATLRKSSGSRAYDDAVQRAILKSSPLPRPERPDLFQRTLALKFRPQD